MTIKETEKASDELLQVFRPWRRFFARMSDIFMYNALWSGFLAFTFNINLAARSRMGNLFDSFIAIAMMLVLEPLWLHLFGTTLGKGILGLRIQTPSGRHLSYSEGLERTWGVIGAGMGYNIPIYKLVRLWKSYNLCNQNETQPWDESISYTLQDTKWYRRVHYIGAYALIFAALLTIISAQQLPPNRGDLTVAEFAENYNYYARFFDLGNEYLDENGKLTEKQTSGTVIYIGGPTEKPEYHFTAENGYITDVSFAIEIKDNESWIGSYDTQMFLASLAFAGAQENMGLFSKIPNRLADRIDNNTFKSYHFVEAGITFSCDIEHSGYIDTQSQLLIPAEDAAETYFNLKFSMSKNSG